MDREASRTSSGSGDYEEDEEDYYDDEATLDEEEMLAKQDDFENEDELKMLAEEGEMSMEELKRKYFGDFDMLPADLETPESSNTSYCEQMKLCHDLPSSSKQRNELAVTSSTSYFTEEILNEENDDEEYTPPPDQYKKAVRLGSNYQVDSLPELQFRPLCHGNGVSSTSGCNFQEVEEDDHATPLWIPAYEVCSSAKVEKYLADYEKLRHQKFCSNKDNQLASLSLNFRHKRSLKKDLFDDENALYELYKANYVVEHVKNKIVFYSPTIQSINGPRLTYKEPWRQFTEKDCINFENGLQTYGKNFYEIHKNVLKDRTVGELVRFYYTWKKTERHDIFVEKNKHITSAIRNESVNTTDFMGNIMDSLTGQNNADLEVNVSQEKKFKTTDEITDAVLTPYTLNNTPDWVNKCNTNNNDLLNSISENF